MEVNEIYKYGKDITWSLPVLFQYEPNWVAIFNAFKRYGIILPQINAFGAPTIAWGGGRKPSVYGEFNANGLLAIFDYIKQANATPTLTFTYTQLTKEDLNDRYANYFLDVALEGNARFIVYSDLLKNHIKEKNSNAHVVASVIKPNIKFQGADRVKDWNFEKETEYYNMLLKEYDTVVVRPEYSKEILHMNPNLIDDISRIEVLINQPCICNCPKMPQHYRYFENMRNTNENIGNFECIKETMQANLQTFKNNLIHSEEIVRKLVNAGVKNLKLQGRGVGILPQTMVYMLLEHMFDQQSDAYLITTEMMYGTVEEEIENFKKLLKGLNQ